MEAEGHHVSPLSLPNSRFSRSSAKEVAYFSDAPVSVMLPTGQHQITWLQLSVGLVCVALQDCVCWHTLKAVTYGFGFQSVLTETLSYADMSWHTLSY